jgi:peptidoglycan lytic transglycosylase A
MPAPIASDSAPKPTPAPAGPPASGVSFRPASWHDLPGWRDDQITEAWSAFNASCGPLASREEWREICATASGMPNPSVDAARRFFERAFTPWLVTSGDGADEGLITGYYEPLLRGSRRPTGRYRFPLYRVPDDLLVVDLSDVYPELKGLRLRGKLDGRRVVPYYDRGQIETGHAPLRGKELVWVDDPIELFFLHIQGSGRILLDSGQTIRVGYADQNGYPYRSIGRLLVERGELALEQASMQGIKSWARSHPEQVAQLLNSNSSYVFFRELPSQAKGPPGSLGVPLTPERSIAVDARVVPLGAPVYIATTWPNSIRPLQRLVFAQDTGGAIRGAVRADLFWGQGEGAAREAGRMKQRLRMWLLLPVGSVPQSQLTAD